MDDLSGIVDDLRKKYCGLSGEVCYNERRQWALREYCQKENRMNQVNYQKELEKILNTSSFIACLSSPVGRGNLNTKFGCIASKFLLSVFL